MTRRGLKAAALALVACLSFAAAALQVNPAVRWAETAVQEIATSMTGVYVSLRVINAALSAAQEVEVGASVGAQANIQPLKVLEPVDDTVERVADVVFAVAIGAAVATVGLMPVAALGAALLRTEATALFEATLTLIGIFVLRSVLLPVLLFWGILALLRRSVGAA